MLLLSKTNKCIIMHIYYRVEVVMNFTTQPKILSIFRNNKKRSYLHNTSIVSYRLKYFLVSYS